MTEELKTWILAEYRKGVVEGAKLSTGHEQNRICALMQARIDNCTLNADEPCALCNENYYLMRQIRGELT